MYLNPIGENKILAKISGFSVLFFKAFTGWVNVVIVEKAMTVLICWAMLRACQVDVENMLSTVIKIVSDGSTFNHRKVDR